MLSTKESQEQIYFSMGNVEYAEVSRAIIVIPCA